MIRHLPPLYASTTSTPSPTLRSDTSRDDGVWGSRQAPNASDVEGFAIVRRNAFGGGTKLGSTLLQYLRRQGTKGKQAGGTPPSQGKTKWRWHRRARGLQKYASQPSWIETRIERTGRGGGGQRSPGFHTPSRLEKRKLAPVTPL